MNPSLDKYEEEALRTFHAQYDALKALLGDADTVEALVVHRDGYGAENLAAQLDLNPSAFGVVVPSSIRDRVLAAVEAAHNAHMMLDRMMAKTQGSQMQSLGRTFEIDERAGLIRYADGRGETAPLVRCEPSRPDDRRRPLARPRNRGRDRSM